MSQNFNLQLFFRSYALVSRFGEEIVYPETGSYVWPPGRHFKPPWYKVSSLSKIIYEFEQI